jgi:uncharacterized protein YvpB
VTKSFLIFLILLLPIVSSIPLWGSVQKTTGETSIATAESYGYISVPFHYQDKPYYCGPAALEMVFDFYGEDVPQEEIADAARTYPNSTHTDELTRAAQFSNTSTSMGMEMPNNITGYSSRKVGYAAFKRNGLTIDDLKALVAKEQPIIVLMNWTQSEPYGHYRVVIGYNDSHIIMHDPWNKGLWGGTFGGPDTAMTRSTFLLLWAYLDNWGLWIHPWSVELQMPTSVDKGENLTVTANITYLCPEPFNTYIFSASNCNATIIIPENLLVTSDEATHSLGQITTNNPVQTTWLINASHTGSFDVSIIVSGMVEGFVETHEIHIGYSYEDETGGSYVKTLLVVPEYQPVLILPLFMIATLLVITVYKRRH